MITSEIVPPIGTPESDEFRRKRINASELADCVQCGKYQSAFEKWEEKTGRVTDQPRNRESIRKMKIGNHLEQFVLEDWCETNCAEVLEYQLPGIACHEPEIRATVESIVLMPDGERIVVEIKTTSSGNSDIDWSGGQPPVYWFVQVQAEMVVAGAERAVIVVMARDTCQTVEFSVPRDRNKWQQLCEWAGEFWRYVASDEVPPHSWAMKGDAIARHRWLEDLGEPIDLRDSEAEDTWAEYERLGKQIREMEKRREECKHEVTVALGDHKCGILSGGRELVIQTVNRAGYVVEPKTYCQLKARKAR